ncbi:MAG: WG repeat-containing protein, partial [Chitinophagaceae bacterium]
AATIGDNELIGVIDYKGAQVLPFEYDECLQQRGDAFVVRKNGKIGAVLRNGKTAIPFVYDALGDDVETCMIALVRGNKTEYFDLEFKKKPLVK